MTNELLFAAGIITGIIAFAIVYFVILPMLHIVLIYQFAFHPGRVAIQRGQKVRWLNLDFATHTVTQGEPNGDPKFKSGDLATGGTFSSFPQKTTLYHCSHHNFMRGKIVVKP